MKLAFVVPRYGATVVGGAERLVRDFAGRLADSGDDVHVWTTCAKSVFSWANEEPEGESFDGKVRVRRFPVTVASDRFVMARLQPVIDSGVALPDSLADEWLRNTGLSQPLLDAIGRESDSFDATIFAPYWVANTVFGARLKPERSLVIPCLHDEAYARFAQVRRTLKSVRGLLFNSAPEADLARNLYGAIAGEVVGVGFDQSLPDPNVARHRFPVDSNSIAYAGRQEAPKRFPLLVEWVLAYNDLLRNGSAPISLVTMGTRAWNVPARATAVLRDLGFVDEAVKQSVFAASLAVANLSRNESFSYVLMEAWVAGTPVIVHSDAEVTRYHCERSGGGVWVQDAAGFAAAIDRLRGDKELARAMGEAGRAYVTSEYSWPAVLQRMRSAIGELLA